MNAQSKLAIKGNLTLMVLDEDLRLKDRRVVKNLVGNVGTAHLAALLAGSAPTQMQYIAIGDGSTAPTITDTTLENELYRAIASVAQGTGGQANEVTFSSTWSAGAAAGTLREAGIFNAASVGDMLSRSTYADVTVGPADTLVVTWDIIFTGV